tara:strand:- start:628 stop:933 length:306 start_codon:yes stop_codon:yes gene_type:complete
MTKIISDVQIKKLMRAYNPKREWSEGCVERLRTNSWQLINFLLSEIETNMEGNKRVQELDIINAYNFIANAIMLAKQPVLRHFVDDNMELFGKVLINKEEE